MINQLILFFLIGSVYCLNSDEISGSVTQRINQEIKVGQHLYLNNSKSKIGILFYKEPKDIMITCKGMLGQYKDVSFNNNYSTSAEYFLLLDTNDTIDITVTKDQIITFSYFVIDVSCNDNIRLFTDLKKVIEFNSNPTENELKLEQNQKKCILIDIQKSVNIEILTDIPSDGLLVNINSANVSRNLKLMFSTPLSIFLNFLSFEGQRYLKLNYTASDSATDDQKRSPIATTMPASTTHANGVLTQFALTSTIAVGFGILITITVVIVVHLKRRIDRDQNAQAPSNRPTNIQQPPVQDQMSFVPNLPEVEDQVAANLDDESDSCIEKLKGYDESSEKKTNPADPYEISQRFGENEEISQVDFSTNDLASGNPYKNKEEETI